MTTEEDSELQQSRTVGVISWMARNSVAAKMLMFVFLVGGLLVARTVKQEVWPAMPSEGAYVGVGYSGAGPEEVEEGILIPLEQALRGIEGVRQVSTKAWEGYGEAFIDFGGTSLDPDGILQNIKDAVDRISTFPAQAEKPFVTLNREQSSEVSLILYGRQSYRAIRDLAERIQDDLSDYPGVGSVRLGMGPSYEIAIEIPLASLQSYHLTLDEVAQKIRDATVNIPGGEVRSSAGKILIRTRERREYGNDFKSIPVATSAEGSFVTLGQIAAITDGFEESDVETLYNGLPAIAIDIYRTESERPSTLSESLRTYLDRLSKELPANIYIKVTKDESRRLDDRMRLLWSDMCIGLGLILVLLSLFLEVRVAFWVTLCIPISMSGAFLLVPFTHRSLNMISVLAFLVALGIIIDYSIIVGEHIYRKREDGSGLWEAAVDGAQEMLIPIIFAIATNAVAFIPLLFIPGRLGHQLAEIPPIAICVLLVTLVEVLLILPAHLALRPSSARIFDLLNRPKIFIGDYTNAFLARVHVPTVNFAIRFRYPLLGCAFVGLLVTIALIISGTIPFVLDETEQNSQIIIQAELPYGAPIEDSIAARERIMKAISSFGIDVTRPTSKIGIYSQIGSPLLPTASGDWDGGAHIVAVSIDFPKPEAVSNQSHLSLDLIARNLRDRIGPLLGVSRLAFSSSFGADPIASLQISLSHRSGHVLESAAKQLSIVLAGYPGVVNVISGLPQGKRQLNFTLNPQGESLGLTPQQLGNQLRDAFLGAEAMRQQRGRSEVKVRVRLPKSERSSAHILEKLVLRTPAKGDVFLSQVASVKENTSYPSIKRSNGRRLITVTASFDPSRVDMTKVEQTLRREDLPSLANRFRGLEYSFGGGESDLSALRIGFAVILLIIYTLLAIPLRSYAQPLIIMSSIPLCIMGAILGHLLLGRAFNTLSLLGVAALSGVVLNSSLIMVLSANAMRLKGFSALAAIRLSVVNRFRPVLLTTVTTFLSVTPMMFRWSSAGDDVVPLAISLGFGILGSTLISFAIVPAMYLVLQDIKLKRFKGR